MSEQKKPNYKAFIPIGITFIGTGIVFMTSINTVLGCGIMGIGLTFLVVGIKKSKQGSD